jgi:hypothetical protein
MDLTQSGRRLVWFRTLAFQANDPGFKSRRPHPNSSSGRHPAIYLLGGNTTKLKVTYDYDKIFEQALRRLQSAPDVADQDKANLKELVEHSLVKGDGAGNYLDRGADE